MGLVNFKIKFKILYLLFPSAFLACELGSKSVLKESAEQGIFTS